MNNKMKNLMRIQDPALGMFNVGCFNDIFEELHHAMDRFWNETTLDTSIFSALQSKTGFPKINVSETDDMYEVEIAVSGFDKENLKLEFKDSCLFIKADKTETDDNKKWLQREISNKSFRRVVRFPSKIASKKITSKYDATKTLVVCSLPKESIEDSGIIKIDIK